MAFRTSSPTGDYDAPQLREASVPVALEVCTIERWRGYVSSTFFARLQDGTALYESKPFRVRDKGPLADEGPAAQAYADLVAALEERGWQRMPDGDGPWYSTQFSRHVATPTVTATPIAPQRPVDILNLAAHRIEATPSVAATPTAPQRPVDILNVERHRTEAIPKPVEVAQPPAEVEVARPHAEAETPPAKVAARARRRPRKLTLVSAAGALIAVGAVALNMAGFGKHSPTLRKAVSQTGVAAQKTQKPAAKPTQAATPPATPKTQKPAAAPTQAATPPTTPNFQTPAAAPTHATLPAVPALRLAIRARSVGSWLEIRRQSPSGPVVFSGLLPGGRTLHLTGVRFWASIGAAGNLAIAVNGGRVKLEGTLEHTFSAPGQ